MFHNVYFKREGLCLFESLEYILYKEKIVRQGGQVFPEYKLKFYKGKNRELDRMGWISFLANIKQPL